MDKINFCNVFCRVVKCIVIIFLPGIIANADVSTKMNSLKLHKVFVYGTLKKGEPNHQWFSKDKEGYRKYLYNAKTVEKYPLIIGSKYNIPFVLFSPGNGAHVEGEVYEVDDKVLAKLDILEDHHTFYVRELYDVKPLTPSGVNETTKVWIYVIKMFKKELLNQTFYQSYSNFGSHGKQYVIRYTLRHDDTYDHKKDVLSNHEDSSLDDLYTREKGGGVANRISVYI